MKSPYVFKAGGWWTLAPPNSVFACVRHGSFLPGLAIEMERFSAAREPSVTVDVRTKQEQLVGTNVGTRQVGEHSPASR
jgi:hypothetical protein